MKAKKKFTPDQPMKRVNWTRVEAPQLKEKSIWVRFNEDKLASNDFIQLMVENFSTKPAKRPVDSTSKTTSSDESTLKKRAQMRELRYLDDKQAQNLNIMLKTLKAEPNEISRWLIECNSDRLTLVILEQLEKFLPEDKLIVKYQELKENIDELDMSEKFLVVVRTTLNSN